MAKLSKRSPNCWGRFLLGISSSPKHSKTLKPFFCVFFLCFWRFPGGAISGGLGQLSLPGAHHPFGAREQQLGDPCLGAMAEAESDGCRLRGGEKIGWAMLAGSAQHFFEGLLVFSGVFPGFEPN